jgi:hypothetical protein
MLAPVQIGVEIYQVAKGRREHQELERKLDQFEGWKRERKEEKATLLELRGALEQGYRDAGGAEPPFARRGRDGSGLEMIAVAKEGLRQLCRAQAGRVEGLETQVRDSLRVPPSESLVLYDAKSCMRIACQNKVGVRCRCATATLAARRFKTGCRTWRLSSSRAGALLARWKTSCARPRWPTTGCQPNSSKWSRRIGNWWGASSSLTNS